MPREVFGKDYEFLDRAELLSFEELTRLTRLTMSLGVSKLRITGGEPLLRKGIEELVSMLAAIDGLDLAMTTNASLLERKAQALADAGLHRVTVSLDSLDDDVFRAMNDADFPVAEVLRGIDAAAAAGLGPIKINAVVQRGVNDDGVVDMARHFKGTGHIVRFIEYMDVGHTNGWRLDDVVPSAEIIDRIGAEIPIEPVDKHYAGEVADRWRYTDGSGEFGVISSVTQPFCATCTRLRVSAQGMVYTCLFATTGNDVRAMMRGLATDEEMLQALRLIWQRRTDRYSEIRTAATAGLEKIEMSYIGG